MLRRIQVHVGDRRLFVGQGRELEVVRCEEREGVDAACELQRAGPGE